MDPECCKPNGFAANKVDFPIQGEPSAGQLGLRRQIAAHTERIQALANGGTLNEQVFMEYSHESAHRFRSPRA